MTTDARISSFWHSRRVLVTGGTGSFGREFVRQLLPLGPSLVRILSRDEHKQGRMAEELGPEAALDFQIGDVRCQNSTRRALDQVDVVVHAAALKVVPSCERHVDEALKTNVYGLQNLLRVLSDSAVERLIVLGSDKAVEPVNTMGLTKALQERLLSSAQNETDAVLSVVRYGNVFGSRSSVVPALWEKLRRGESLPIMDPSMTRFFLSLQQAGEIILDCGSRAVGGEVFVPRLRSLNIETLVKCLQTYFDGQCPVVITGARPGEKQHETLVSQHEIHRTRVQGREYIVLPSNPMPKRHAGYEKLPVLQQAFDSLHAESLGAERVHEMLRSGGFLDEAEAGEGAAAGEAT